MPIITARKDEILDSLLLNSAFTARNGNTLSLHTADPGQTGANEVSGGSYSRQTIPWEGSATGGDLTTTDDIEFDGMPTATVTHVTVWDSSTPIWYGALASSVSVSAGQTLRISSGQLTAALNDPA